MQGFKTISGLFGCVALICVSVASADVPDQVAHLEQLGVDPAGVQSLVDHMNGQGVSPEIQELHLNRLASLASSNLPVGALLNRYLEGFSKNIPLPRIDAVVRQLADRMMEAGSFVDASIRASEVEFTPQDRLDAIDQACYALGVGVVPANLTQSLDMVCRSAENGYAWSSPLVTMSILVSAGIASEQSFDVLNTAWSHGYRGRELELLGRAVAGSDQSGEAASMVVDLLLADHGLDAVFENLETLRGAPKTGMIPGEVHDPPSGKRVLPRRDKDPSPISPVSRRTS